MNITFDDERERVKFEDLEAGDLFGFCGNYYIKLPFRYKQEYEHYYHNSINLENGYGGSVNDDTEVVKVQYQLIIKN